MASILKRGDFSYQATVRRRGFPSKTKTFETKTDATKWARMIERDMDRGAWQDTSLAERLTLGEVLSRYKNEVTSAKKSADIEEGKINAILREPMCQLKMSTLSGSDIASWRDKRLKAVKGATINRELAIVTHAIEIARKEWGVNVANPCKLVRRATASAPRNRRLVGTEDAYLMRALAVTKNRYVKPMVIMAIESAMRRGELLSLEWENVDLEKRTAFLPFTKTNESRHVPLSSVVIGLLKALPRTEDPHVFPITMETFKQAYVRSVERAKKQYGVDCLKNGIAANAKFMTNLRFHDLRHEGASRFFEIGLNVMEVASITGHKSLQMLQRYTHLRAEDLANKLR